MKFVIVYEKFTKPAAVSLSNQLSNKFECTIWDKRHYLANEAGLNNKNRIILLNEDLINENLANPSLHSDQIVPGMDYKREGNMIGVVYNEVKSPKKLSDILKENWGKYAAAIIGSSVLGIPGAAITAWLLTSQKKKIKFKLYMDAVDVLAKSKLQDILNG
ncbi:MAG: hypothetical protein K2G35_02650 [Duncaniella sp.]|nr:hypothetical protein [Duncaniella sp.]